VGKGEERLFIGFAINARHPCDGLRGQAQTIQFLIHQPGNQLLAGAPLTAQAQPEAGGMPAATLAPGDANGEVCAIG